MNGYRRSLAGMTLCLGLGAGSCKIKQDDEQVKSDPAAESLALTAGETSSFDPFKGSSKSIYTMSRADLQRVPPGDLQKEISILEIRNEAEKKDLTNVKAFNLAMCKSLEQLKRDCVAQLYISDTHGLDEFDCVDQEDREKEPEAEIRVTLQGSQDKHFVLIANSVYVSDEFSAASSQPIKFKREDQKTIKPPRFRDLESLYIVAVKSGGTPADHVPMPPIDGFKVKITVNGKPLSAGDENGFLRLAKMDDPLNNWSYRIDPNGILELGNAPECVVTLDELKEIQENSRVLK